VDLIGRFADDLHGMLREAAEVGPLATDEATGAIVVLRQRDLEALAHDPRLVGPGLLTFDMMGITDGPLRDWWKRVMFTSDGDYHRRMRSLVSRAFTPRSVESLRETSAVMCADALATLGKDGGDLAKIFSSLATHLTCRLLGVPDSDVKMFVEWADSLSPVFFMMTPEQIRTATTAIVEMESYIDELTQRRALDPGNDLITALLTAEADGERLTHQETITMISNLLIAGHDTVGTQIPCSLLVALQHRDDIVASLTDTARLSSAVAETMRMEPSVPLVLRVTREPIEAHGMTIPTGSLVFPCIAAASRDASAWRDPDRFDPERFSRPDTPRLMNFGAGPHFCLGTALARIAVEECVRAVLTVDPPLRLTEDPAHIPWRQVLGRSPSRLLVESDATGTA
jgi:cytochrome P450